MLRACRRRSRRCHFPLAGPVEGAVAQPAMGGVVLERKRIGDAAAREGETSLPAQERQVLRPPDALGMRAAFEQSRGHEAGHILRIYRSVADPALGRLHLDQGFQFEDPARAVAHHRDLAPGFPGGGEDRPRHLVGAHRQRRGVARNEDPQRQRRSPPTRLAAEAAVRRATGSPSSSAAGPLAQRPRQ